MRACAANRDGVHAAHDNGVGVFGMILIAYFMLLDEMAISRLPLSLVKSSSKSHLLLDKIFYHVSQ